MATMQTLRTKRGVCIPLSVVSDQKDPYMKTEESLREQLADLCHRQWSGWMDYLFDLSSYDESEGTVTIPKWAVERWNRQRATFYEELTKDERESDRKEADKFLEIIKNARL